MFNQNDKPPFISEYEEEFNGVNFEIGITPLGLASKIDIPHDALLELLDVDLCELKSSNDISADEAILIDATNERKNVIKLNEISSFIVNNFITRIIIVGKQSEHDVVLIVSGMESVMDNGNVGFIREETSKRITDTYEGTDAQILDPKTLGIYKVFEYIWDAFSHDSYEFHKALETVDPNVKSITCIDKEYLIDRTHKLIERFFTISTRNKHSQFLANLQSKTKRPKT